MGNKSAFVGNDAALGFIVKKPGFDVASTTDRFVPMREL
jgi:hypothetical protein